MKLEQYQSAIESSNIISKTDIHGIITFVNEEFCKISGYSKEELVGQNHNIVRHPDVPSSTFKLLWDTILQKNTYRSTVQNRAKNGNTFYVNTTVFPILNEDNTIGEFIAIRYDVTQSVHLSEALLAKEKELEQLNATLEQRVKNKTKALLELNQTLETRIFEEVTKNREKDKVLFQQSRLASMGEMIANIAHQWRQPLSELNITLYKMNKFYTNLQDEHEKKFEKSYIHAKNIISKMSLTIEDFRSFFSADRKNESFKLSVVAKEAIDIMQGTLEHHGIKVTMDVKKDVSVTGYFNEATQVIINLFNNSIDAFSCKKIKKRIIHIEIGTNSFKDAIIKICDTGRGIDDAILDKIFEPYFTTKHASVGTGLGLYMSKMIITNSMKGAITAHNVEEGVCFTITIPITNASKDIS